MTEPVRQQPPGFPFPDEEIIYSSARNAPNFELGEDSWFCVSRLDQTAVHEFGEKVHENQYRFTVHTPVRGSTSMLINPYDAQAIVQAMLSVLADHDGGPRDPPGEHTINLEYYDRLVADSYDLESYE